MPTEQEYERAAIGDGWLLIREELDRALVFEHIDGRVNYNTTWGELCEEQDIIPESL